MEANNLDGINTLRYSDIFLAMYFNDGMSNYTGRSLATFKRDFKKISDLPPPEMDYPPQVGSRPCPHSVRQTESDGNMLRRRLQEPFAFLESI